MTRRHRGNNPKINNAILAIIAGIGFSSKEEPLRGGNSLSLP
jgi:hypothetical protein